MKTMTEARAALTEAREAYRRDLQWLRNNYGILPDVEAHVIKGALLTALDALERNDLASLTKAVSSFEMVHADLMAQIAWDLLEQTKRSLKALREKEPELFEKKLQLWNKASWAFTTARFMKSTAKYRESIRTVTQV